MSKTHRKKTDETFTKEDGLTPPLPSQKKNKYVAYWLTII